MIGAILGGATALTSAVSSIINFAQANKDERDAEARANKLMGMQEVDKYAAVQSPDILSLSRQQTAQQTAGATQAVQGMGPEGAAQIANIYQAGREAELGAVQKQAELNFDVDTMKAQAAQAVAQRNLERQRQIEMMRLIGAQEAAAQNRQAGMAGVEGIFAGAGMAAGDIIGMSNPYGKSYTGLEKQKQKDIKSGKYFSFDQSTPAYMGEFDILPQ